jgi:hypothetical protein
LNTVGVAHSSGFSCQRHRMSPPPTTTNKQTTTQKISYQPNTYQHTKPTALARSFVGVGVVSVSSLFVVSSSCSALSILPVLPVGVCCLPVLPAVPCCLSYLPPCMPAPIYSRYPLFASRVSGLFCCSAVVSCSWSMLPSATPYALSA